MYERDCPSRIDKPLILWLGLQLHEIVAVFTPGVATALISMPMVGPLGPVLGLIAGARRGRVPRPPRRRAGRDFRTALPRRILDDRAGAAPTSVPPPRAVRRWTEETAPQPGPGERRAPYLRSTMDGALRSVAERIVRTRILLVAVLDLAAVALVETRSMKVLRFLRVTKHPIFGNAAGYAGVTYSHGESRWPSLRRA
jgi:hypothetical protein